jgi:hypothetical protein
MCTSSTSQTHKFRFEHDEPNQFFWINVTELVQKRAFRACTFEPFQTKVFSFVEKPKTKLFSLEVINWISPEAKLDYSEIGEN